MQPDKKQLLKIIPHKYSRCKKHFLATMQYLGEIVVVILLAVTSYGSLQNGVLKIQIPSPTLPLLPSNATVREFYGGDITTPFSTVLQSDVALILYYAPWDFDSQLAIQNFEEIAKKYSSQVFFSSINCWIHSGSCKKIFPKLRSFPLIMGYVGASRGVQYRGLLQYDHIDEFVQSLLTPLVRIETVTDLNKLFVASTVIVTGFFNFDLVKPNGFYPFYTASLRYLEYNSRTSVAFAIITNPSAAERLGINLPTCQQFDLRLHLWNETLIYPHNVNTIDISQLLQWIHYRSRSPMQFIWPSSRKNQMIQQYLIQEPQPFLILFTSNLRPSYQTMLVKEVAFCYKNCASSPRINRLIREIELQRHSKEISRLVSERQCGISEKRSCVSTNVSTNASQASEDNSIEKECEFSFESTSLEFEGLGCRTNRTLNFFVVNSNQYPDLLINLGYSSRWIQQNTHAAFVVDPKLESHYIMTLPLTRQNLQDFVINFTENRLTKFRRSQRKSKFCRPGRVCVEEISANEFTRIVLDPRQDVIVFYKKKGCIFCEVGARFFLKLSQMFSLPISSVLRNVQPQEMKFVTIDAEENDLPWQHTVHKYPTIIFYPAHRKHDSRVYPHNSELNEANLLNFTLSQLSKKKRLIWFARFCPDTTCLQEAQRQIDTQILLIDRKIRSLRKRSLWPEDSDQTLVAKIRNLLKERHFFKELKYAVRKIVIDLLGSKKPGDYRDGIGSLT